MRKTKLSNLLSKGRKITYGIVQPGPYDPNGVVMIRSQDYSKGWNGIETLYKVSMTVDKPYQRSRVRHKDVLLTVVGANIGKIEVLPKKLDGANISRSVARISLDKEKCEPLYLSYYLKNQIDKLIHINQVGGAQPVLNLKDLGRFQILLPSKSEQEKIAEILLTWDTAIEKTQKLIDQLQFRKKGLMQQLLSAKIRLPGFNGKWEEYSYKSILKEVKRPITWDDEELYQLISVRRRSGGLFKRESLFGKEIKTKNLRIAKEGDFLISKMQIVHGASGLVTSKFDNMKISGSYLALRAKNENQLDMKFFSWLSKLPKFYHQTYISSYGVHIEKMTFNYKSFLKLKVELPKLQEQEAIVSVLDEAEEEIRLQSNYLKSLKSQKKGLMQELLTGKKRVKIDEYRKKTY
ncbi:restriction endonuclease subunit S [Christiangramia echinicola]|uniref:restriction endonuclease subunit S n=1 Tax=Christiangramia echinicola TaxID=279359 RepID=UPI00146CF8A8|nr:restriction endonuclease subunit S [Christiangramia echinicola]